MPSPTDLYRESVERLAKDGVNQRLTNTGPDHAEIVLTNIFTHAKSDVRILSGSLRTVYDRPALVNAAQEFLKRGGKLQILIQGELSEEGKAFVGVLPKDAGWSIDSIGASSIVPLHFAVADNKAYRLETSDSKAEAVVNFNEPNIAIALAGIFDKALKQSKPELASV